MTKEKGVPETHLQKEKIQKVAQTTFESLKKTTQTTFESLKPAVANWWLFMKTKIGPIWSVIIILLGLLLCVGNFWAGLLYVFLIGPIAILIVKYARPDVIVTTGSLLEAKLKWDFIIPAFAILASWGITITVIQDKEEAANAQPNYEFACSEEGIKKTGKAGCKKAKEKFLARLQKELTPIREKYTEEKRLVSQYEKEKAKKCTEEGIAEYGSAGCEQASNNLEQHTKLKNEYQEEVERLTQKMDEVKR